MKSFFKKIGKGLKKLGKGIMKVMNSKIGRVIGMVSLAFGIGSIFKAMFEGVGKATTQGLLQEGGKEAIGETGKTVVEETGKNIVTETGKESSIKIGEKLAGKISTEVTGEAATVSNIGEAVDLIDATKESAINLGGDTNASSITESTQKALDLSTQETTKQAKTEFTTSSVLENAPQEVASLDTNSMASKVLNASPADYAANAETLSSGYTPPPEYINVTQEKNLQAIQDMKKMKPSKLRDFLKNPENRALYEDLSTIPDSGLIEAGQIEGVQEFSSFGEAWKGGDSLLNKTGNVFERAITYDVGELTKGSVKGYGGNLPVMATTQKTASLLAGPPEVVTPTMPNRYAPSIVADLQNQAATTMYTAPSPTYDFTRQISTGANPFQAMSSIRQNAGFSNIYGSLNSLAGV